MVVRRKVRRLRGGGNNGWGKHHRGAGNRGGRGNAGRGKRGAQKKPSFRDQPLGKFGFNARANPEVTITIRDLEDRLATWLAKGLVTEEKGMIHVDLSKLGYTKLLGQGKIRHKLHITVEKASKATVEKLKAAGGAAE
jgi:large subunit ribosomal protein L15